MLCLGLGARYTRHHQLFRSTKPDTTATTANLARAVAEVHPNRLLPQTLFHLLDAASAYELVIRDIASCLDPRDPSSSRDGAFVYPCLFNRSARRRPRIVLDPDACASDAS